jgi:hypothetical protein
VPYYIFDQNNTGGSFIGPAVYVAVNGSSPEEANIKAEAAGLYFDGADDCGCCGNRWHKAYEAAETFDTRQEAEAYFIHIWDSHYSYPPSVPFALVVD